MCRPLLDGGRGGGEGSVRHVCDILVQHAQAAVHRRSAPHAYPPAPHAYPPASHHHSPAFSASAAAAAVARHAPTARGRQAGPDGWTGGGGVAGGDGGPGRAMEMELAERAQEPYLTRTR